jgi:uncharacterized repeat protein (TIGR01451 family)
MRETRSIRQAFRALRDGSAARRRGPALLAVACALVLAALAAAQPARAAPPPGTPIDNLATGTAADSLSGTPLLEPSNVVRAIVAAPPPPPALAFFTDATFSTPTTAGSVGQPLFVEAVAAACDLSPAAPDTVTITLAALSSGDLESFRAVESGNATGRFRILPPVPTADQAVSPPAPNSGVLEAARNDHVVATLAGCGAALSQAHLWLDPAGVAFDSRNNAPLPGVSVTLVDVLGLGNGGNPGGAARVFQPDGLTPAPSTVVTDAAGRYLFPWLAPSTYRIQVAPAAPWTFPSSLPPGALPAGRQVDPAGSYGADFPVTLAGAPVAFDLPLDAAAGTTLFLEMSASRPFVERGDELDYRLRVDNRSDSALASVSVAGLLPAGFAYVPGSSRRDGAAIADPAGGRGPALALGIGALAPRSVATVALRARVGPAAPIGEARAQATASAALQTSNPASALVTVVGGVFADEAMLVGAVFVDRDGDGLRGPADPGMPGVRLWLDDGTFAITDPDGQYSFYGLAPRTHALKVDPTSLPRLTRLVAHDHRDGTRGGLRFVDLQRGDFQRADVAVAADTLALIAADERRRAHARFSSEIVRSLQEGRALEPPPGPAGEPRARPTAAIISGEAQIPLFSPEDEYQTEARSEGTLASTSPLPTATSAARAPRLSLYALLPRLAPVPGFVDLANGDTLATSQISVRVQGPAGPELELRVNGLLVPASRVGLRVASPELGVQAWEYVGVQLEAGSNLLEVSASGVRQRGEVQVIAPDALGRLVVSTAGAVPADGHSVAHVRVRALDRHGVTVTSRTFVTLETDLGRWLAGERDLDPDTPGLQVVLEEGVGTFGLVAPPTPGLSTVRALGEGTRGEASIEFLPELRPLLAVGSVEGVVSLADLTRGPRAPRQPDHGFEARHEFFADERRDGSAAASARGSLFMKGRVREDLLLTLGFDSDRPEELRRFRDVQPNDFYPVYGDASVRGYDAQSTGRLFAKLERRGASLLYGDFVTLGAGGPQSLALYSRSLTGVQQRVENRRVRLDAFASRDRSRQRVDELPGLGISGPYQLTAAPIVENSERVELVTRDRNQPSVVLAALPQARFADYEIEPLTGRILFKSPVPGYDAQLNPVTVRASYEVEGGGDAYWTSGVEGRVKLTERLEVGGSYVDDLAPGAAYELRSAFMGTRLSPASTLEAEYASTRTTGELRGHGGRLELKHESARMQARAFGALTDDAFSNPSAGFTRGRGEAGGRLLARLDERSQLRGEALYTADAGGDARRGGVLVGLDRMLSRTMKGEFGVRVAGETRAGPGAAPTLVALRSRFSSQWIRHPEMTGYLELEQDLLTPRRLVAVGGEYRFHARGRVYTRHELISSLTGPWAMRPGERRLANVIGLDADLGPDAHVFSEYRAGDALAGREAEAAVGLRNTWRLPNGMRMGGSFERVNPLQGDPRGPATAVAGWLDHREDPLWKGSTRYEVRFSGTGSSYLSTTSLAGRVAERWTALCRNLLSLSDEGVDEVARERFQIGLAHRGPGPRAWETLARYELRMDRDAPPAEGPRRRLAHVLSTHVAGRVAAHLNPSLAVAAKSARDRAGGLSTTSRAAWLHGRLTWDFGQAWDAGVSASSLFGGSLRSRSDGFGVELGRMMQEGVWLSAGWNYFGYEDPDLPEEAWTRRGVYLRVRARFDEDLLLRGMGRLP